MYGCSYLYCIVVFIVRVYEEPGPVGDGGLAVEEPVRVEVHCVREVNNLPNVIKADCTRLEIMSLPHLPPLVCDGEGGCPQHDLPVLQLPEHGVPASVLRHGPEDIVDIVDIVCRYCIYKFLKLYLGSRMV